jgi:hypothetical protein
MPVNRERKMVDVEVGSLSLNYSTLEDAKKQINYLIEHFGPSAEIHQEQYPYSDSSHLAVYAKRPETDIQMARRIADEERWELEREKRDREEFDRLQKKFGS